MNILITGGAGFIGSHYADTFIERGHQVTVFDKMPQIHEFRAEFIRGDIKDRRAVEEAVRRHDFVIHAGGMLGTHETVNAPTATAQENILGGLNVLDAVTRYGNRLINISKPNVWLNPYSITKDCIEKFCFMHVREFGTKLAIIKPFNVYGPRQKYARVQKAIPTWIVQALRGQPLEVFGSGRATMDLVHVNDICNGTAAVLEQFDACCIQDSDEISVDVWGNFPAYNRQVLEIGSGEEISVNDTISLLQAALGIDVEVRHVPMRRGEVDGTRLCSNNSQLARLTGYRPTVDLGEGLRETVEYYRANLDHIARGKL
jgi:UDP-glucose 4-epimerase